MSPQGCRRLLINFTARAVRLVDPLMRRQVPVPAALEVQAGARTARASFRRLYFASSRVEFQGARQQVVEALEATVLGLQVLRLLDRLPPGGEMAIEAGRDLIAAIELQRVPWTAADHQTADPPDLAGPHPPRPP